MSNDMIAVHKGAFNLKEFLVWSGIGRTKALEEIATRKLRAVKVGRRLLIPVDAAKAWLANQPAACSSTLD